MQITSRKANKKEIEVPPIDVNERITKDLEKLTFPWKLPNPKSYIFFNGSIIDTLNGETLTGLAVVTKDGYIQDVICNELAQSLDSKIYTKVDCSGKFLSPGLFDHHVHATSSPGEKDLRRLMRLPLAIGEMRSGKSVELMLNRGFTTVRDCGGALSNLSSAIDQGIFHGPRLIRSGKALSQTGGHGDSRDADLPSEAFDSCECHLNCVATVVDGVPAVLKAARENFREGASLIKIMGSGGVASPTDSLTNVQYTTEELKAIVEVSESYGSYTTAHCYTSKSIMHCINAGVKGIEHGNLIDDEAAKLMAEKGCFLTPTLITYKVMASDQFSHFLTPDSYEKNQAILHSGLGSLLVAKKNGVKICYGSDLLGSLGGYQTGEFFLRGKVLTAAEILKSATVTPAECNGMEELIGQIK
ncbi:hypothetical protein CANARDRAFT_30829, partial [[Candida] arabinofermentans NRRL YB-2248]